LLEFLLNFILMPLFVLGIIIFVHEMGHYTVARLYKFPIPVFSIGFGKEIFGITDQHGTRWKLSIFPLGGYVSITSLDNFPLYQRSQVALAGPAANFIFGLILMILVGFIMGAPTTPPYVVSVNTHGGAYEAGILPRDKVISLDGQSIPYHMDKIREVIEASEDGTVDVEVLRNDQKINYTVSVRQFDRTGDYGGTYKKKMLGVVFAGSNLKISAIKKVGDIDTQNNIDLARQELIKNFDRQVVINFGKGDDREDFLVFVDSSMNTGLLDSSSQDYETLVMWDEKFRSFRPQGLIESVKEAVTLFYDSFNVTFGSIYQIIIGKKTADDLGGVVHISNMTGDISEQVPEIGPYYLFRLIVVLSFSIGLINLLPFPVLDGGHILFHAIEKVRGKPPSLTTQGYIYGVSIVFLIFVMLIVGYRDLVQHVPT
jgi:regulator of sigma E protease